MTNAVAVAQYGGVGATKNRIINGAMMIDQRNAGGSVSTPTPSTLYTVDRMQAVFTQASKYTAQQNAGSVTPPAGFRNYLGFTSSSAYSVLSSDVFALRQHIEGFNIADLGWGAAGAVTVTLSFWVRSSLTGTFGGSLMNSAQDRAYPFSYTISAANTWEQKSVTIAGDTTGTWLTTTGTGVMVNFSLGTGSTFSGTASAWAATNLWSVTGATSVVGTSGATFYITGVQLEKGTTATPFEQRLYGTELALCQRYCIAIAAGNAHAIYGAGMNYTTTSGSSYSALPVPMRASPTVTYGTQTELGCWNASGSTQQCSSVTANGSFPFGFGTTYNIAAANLVAGNGNVLKDRGNGSSSILATAEL